MTVTQFPVSGNLAGGKSHLCIYIYIYVCVCVYARFCMNRYHKSWKQKHEDEI